MERWRANPVNREIVGWLRRKGGGENQPTMKHVVGWRHGKGWVTRTDDKRSNQ